MNVPSFETPRLRLRPFRDDDAIELHRILTQPDMLKYFPRPGGPPLERVQKLVRNQIEQWDTVGYAWWAVEMKTTGVLAGWNGLQYLPDTRETEIGYLIDRPLWGQGLTTEAARVGLRYALHDLGLPEIIALAHPENLASRRVMQKLGMTFDRVTEYFGMDMARYTIDASAYARSAQALTPLA